MTAFSTFAPLLLALGSAHFTLTWPPGRAGGSMKTAGWCHGENPHIIPQNGTCLWFNDGCLIGCDRCDGSLMQKGKAGCNPLDPNQPMAPTLPPKFRSWADDRHDVIGDNSTFFHPWQAPGWAPVESSCGLAGGYYIAKNGFPGNGGYPPIGVQQGFDGVNLPVRGRTVWRAGSAQEVAVSVSANHGGGYHYRLCRAPDEYHRLTEECFQQNPLDFVGPYSWLQWGDNKATRKRFKATTVIEGTKPAGSQWRRFPMPGCLKLMGGDAAGKPDGHGPVQAGEECNATQFPPPYPGVFGFGLTQCTFPARPGVPTQGGHGQAGRDAPTCSWDEVQMVGDFFNINFIDLIRVPEYLEPGNYVLSWRHDCEQSPQVWASCADIKIVKGDPEHPHPGKHSA